MKNPDSRYAISGFMGEQFHLIDPPLFSSTYSNSSTPSAGALAFLRIWRMITTPDLQEVFGNPRFSAYVDPLIKKHAWHISAKEILFSANPRQNIVGDSITLGILKIVGGSHE